MRTKRLKQLSSKGLKSLSSGRRTQARIPRRSVIENESQGAANGSSGELLGESLGDPLADQPEKRVGHVPLRTCVVCRRKAPKIELRRFVRNSDQGALVDLRQQLPGRGFYVCNHLLCLDKLTSTGKRRKRCKGEMHGQ
nr:YlxR family protein [Desulfonatronum lacustre]